jgi:hypothetical protein
MCVVFGCYALEKFWDPLKLVLKHYDRETFTIMHMVSLCNITFSPSSQSHLNIIGNLPFVQDKIKEYFTSDNSVITKSTIYKDKTDTTITSVALEINLRDLNKISVAKGFTGVDASWVKSDSGMVMRWLFTPANKNTNEITSYQISFNFEGDVKSTNGVKKDKTVTYFVTADKMDPKGAYFTATIDSDGKTSRTFKGKETNVSNENPKSVNKTEENKPSSCGLFGIELPLVLLGGLAISKGLKSKKK